MILGGQNGAFLTCIKVCGAPIPDFTSTLAWLCGTPPPGYSATAVSSLPGGPLLGGGNFFASLGTLSGTSLYQGFASLGTLSGTSLYQGFASLGTLSGTSLYRSSCAAV
jgi:hypothetical protein